MVRIWVAAILLLASAASVCGQELLARVRTPVFVRPDSMSMVIAIVRAGDRIAQDTAIAPGKWHAVVVPAGRGYVRSWQVSQLGVAAGATLAKGLVDGNLAAEHVRMSGRFVGGLFAGLTFGLIGTLVAYNSAGGSAAALPPWISDSSPKYIAGFQQSYNARLRDRRQSTALTGGLIGTLAGAAIWYYVLTQ